MMGIARFAVLLALLPTAALAQTRTYQDASGREVGRSVTNQNGTVFYDAMGRTTGRSSTDSNGTTTIYDQMGRQVGTIRGKAR
jgi:hypothetical protein